MTTSFEVLIATQSGWMFLTFRGNSFLLVENWIDKEDEKKSDGHALLYSYPERLA